MQKSWPILLVFCSIFCLACASSNTTARWVKLGERTVNHRVERDVIPVTAARGDFRKIKLKVRHRAVTFRAVHVHYRNGRVQKVELRKNIPAGGETRVIDLVGDDRIIKEVTFIYDTATGRGDRAVVQLFGRR